MFLIEWFLFQQNRASDLWSTLSFIDSAIEWPKIGYQDGYEPLEEEELSRIMHSIYKLYNFTLDEAETAFGDFDT
jgi:hypothetical protein